MKFLLLIYENEANWTGLSEEEGAKVFAEYGAYNEDLAEGGHFQVAEALQPVAAATTVRVRGGETRRTDGPAVDTGEALGGFYLIEAASLDEAVELAARCPGARSGSVEVRPVMEIPEGP